MTATGQNQKLSGHVFLPEFQNRPRHGLIPKVLGGKETGQIMLVHSRMFSQELHEMLISTCRNPEFFWICFFSLDDSGSPFAILWANVVGAFVRLKVSANSEVEVLIGQQHWAVRSRR